jgi:glucoamylase
LKVESIDFVFYYNQMVRMFVKPLSQVTLLGALLSSAVVASAASGLDTFVSSESETALRGVLANIGPNGAKVPGADAGIVVASPSQTDPDCK